ncbi:histidinol-phosphate transaminase [Gammaproteobacteria bacterium]|nr:histidinol-phosphate transaminase [Gammaproteobacteria bacterium]
MSADLLQNLNPGIADLHPYEPGKSIDEVMLAYGHTEVIKLASNENPLGASPKALAKLNSLPGSFHLYPDGNGTKLKNVIAKHEKLLSENIILGNGSNEILELAARAFLNPGSSAVASCHAFVVYKIVTQSSGATLIEVPTIDWGHNLEAFPANIRDDTKVIFIANPNNPTGTYNSHQEVHCLLKNIPSSILVVLDCAYFEYVKKRDYVNPLALLNEFDNLLVTKSFSKIQGLASARIGYGIGQPELIEVLNRIRQPFNVNSFAQELACEAINDKEHIKKSIDLNLAEGTFLFTELTQLGLECIPSVGNFISFKGNFNGKEMFTSLMEKGVVVRPIDLYGMPNFLRVTIGTHQENVRFLAELKGLL